jgi:hypothetical protein
MAEMHPMFELQPPVADSHDNECVRSSITGPCRASSSQLQEADVRMVFFNDLLLAVNQLANHLANLRRQD